MYLSLLRGNMLLEFKIREDFKRKVFEQLLRVNQEGYGQNSSLSNVECCTPGFQFHYIFWLRLQLHSQCSVSLIGFFILCWIKSKHKKVQTRKCAYVLLWWGLKTYLAFGRLLRERGRSYGWCEVQPVGNPNECSAHTNTPELWFSRVHFLIQV